MATRLTTVPPYWRGLRFRARWDELDPAGLSQSVERGGFAGFGQSVAISSDTIVVAAPYEDSSVTDVNGDQTDNSALDAGPRTSLCATGRLGSSRPI